MEMEDYGEKEGQAIQAYHFYLFFQSLKIKGNKKAPLLSGGAFNT